MAQTTSTRSDNHGSFHPPSADPHLPRIWIRPYYKSFNGIRGFAVMIVFLCHYAIFWNMRWLANFTWEGVDLFFVLSGFLITGILYDALDGPDFFRNFYIRRSLRIFPIFFGFFLLLSLATPIFHLHYPLSLLFYVAYVGNLILPFAHHNPTIVSIFRHGRSLPVANIGHLWSLCVEEQFYILWPTVIWLVRDRKKLLRVCTVLIVATFLVRVILIYLLIRTKHDLNGQNLVFWSTYTRCDTLIIGAWMALWLRANPISLLKLRRLSSLLFWGSVAAIAVGDLLPAPGLRTPRGPFISTFGFTLVALASAGLILRCLDENSRVARFFQLRSLAFLGVISYGFYFFHSMFRDLWMVLQAHHPRIAFAIPLLAFASTVLVAYLSFRFFETPFLRLKRTLAPQPAAKDGRPAHLHLSVPEVDG